MLLSAPRGKSEEKQQTAFLGSTRATPRTCAVAPYRSKAFAAERVHERLRKRGGMGHEAGGAAREINDLSAQLPRQHPVWLGGHLAVGVASAVWHDPRGCRLGCVPLELYPL